MESQVLTCIFPGGCSTPTPLEAPPHPTRPHLCSVFSRHPPLHAFPRGPARPLLSAPRLHSAAPTHGTADPGRAPGRSQCGWWVLNTPYLFPLGAQAPEPPRSRRLCVELCWGGKGVGAGLVSLTQGQAQIPTWLRAGGRGRGPWLEILPQTLAAAEAGAPLGTPDADSLRLGYKPQTHSGPGGAAPLQTLGLGWQAGRSTGWEERP